MLKKNNGLASYTEKDIASTKIFGSFDFFKFVLVAEKFEKCPK